MTLQFCRVDYVGGHDYALSMNLDVRSDEGAEPHWYIGHGKLSEVDEEGRKIFREFFAAGHSLKQAVSLMVNRNKFEDQDWDLAEMLMLLIVTWIQSGKEKE